MKEKIDMFFYYYSMKEDFAFSIQYVKYLDCVCLYIYELAFLKEWESLNSKDFLVGYGSNKRLTIE